VEDSGQGGIMNVFDESRLENETEINLGNLKA